MAGIAAYDDLRKLMLDSGPWMQKHCLESVKIIHEGNEHDPENYGRFIIFAVKKNGFGSLQQRNGEDAKPTPKALRM
jgi:hypothetical protein